MLRWWLRLSATVLRVLHDHRFPTDNIDDAPDGDDLLTKVDVRPTKAAQRLSAEAGQRRSREKRIQVWVDRPRRDNQRIDVLTCRSRCTPLWGRRLLVHQGR